MGFIFDKLAPTPLNKRFKICFNSFSESISVQKTVSEMLKRGISLFLRFVQQANKGSVAPEPSGYATDHSTMQALNLVCIVLLCDKSK